MAVQERTTETILGHLAENRTQPRVWCRAIRPSPRCVSTGNRREPARHAMAGLRRIVSDAPLHHPQSREATTWSRLLPSGCVPL